MRPILKMPDEEIPAFISDTRLRRTLVETVGAYCAFCEVPLSSDLRSVQKVSASIKPTGFTIGGIAIQTSFGVKPSRFASAWANLLPACAACAAAKGEALGSEVGLRALYAEDPATFGEIVGAGGRLRLTDLHADILLGYSLRQWVWPDTAGNEDGEIAVLDGDWTWDLFTYERSVQSMADLAARNLVRLDAADAVRAWAQAPADQLWVVPNEGWIAAQSDAALLRARVQATLLGLNLNYHKPDDPLAADRRVALRTDAGQLGTDCLADLTELVRDIRSGALAGDNPDDDFESTRLELLLEFVRESVRATGFWSVWLRVFVHGILDPGSAAWSIYSIEARKLLLYRIFAQYEIDLRRLGEPRAIRASKDDPIPPDAPVDEIESRMVLPGTDLGKVSLWL